MVTVLGKETTQLNVIVKTSSETLFEGVAASVTSTNAKGEFDVLPQHANFITLVTEYVVIDRGRVTEKEFKLEKGLLSAILDDVSVYVGL
jgi:F0F1-type ATP synthase epsilon subunit